MIDVETVDELTHIIEKQAEIIQKQAGLLAQHEAVTELEERMKKGELNV